MIETEEQIIEPTTAVTMTATNTSAIGLNASGVSVSGGGVSAIISTGWDDPTQVNWGEEDAEGEKEEESFVPEQKEAIFKCTALYSYTVSKLFYIIILF